MISLINFICTRANDLAGKPARQRLGHIEEMLELLGELDSSN